MTSAASLPAHRLTSIRWTALWVLVGALVAAAPLSDRTGGVNQKPGAGNVKIGLPHVSFITLGCFACAMLASKRLSRSISSKINRLLCSIVAVAFIVYCYHGIIHAAELNFMSWKLFFQFMLAGGICALLTHAACTPIDVVKTRLQTSNKYIGAADAFRTIVREEGPRTLLKGLGATATGYFLHGAFKYSFYEVFKLIVATSPQLAVTKPPMSVAALAGFLAECVACMLLCPMEAVRIRSVADVTFPSSALSGLKLLAKTEGLFGLYKGLPSLLMRQVPYTVGQFVSFEFTLRFVKLLFEPYFRSSSEISGTGAALISLSAGLLAGCMAAVISQPGDTILSKINQAEGEDQGTIAQITTVVTKLGFVGLFLGLLTRLVQVSCMIGGQFMIYDTIKMLCGIRPASAVPSMVANAVAEAAKNSP